MIDKELLQILEDKYFHVHVIEKQDETLRDIAMHNTHFVMKNDEIIHRGDIRSIKSMVLSK